MACPDVDRAIAAGDLKLAAALIALKVESAASTRKQS
jgi:hypothetical protein